MGKRDSEREAKAFFNGAGRRGVVIAPSILSADFAEMGRELARCRRARARWIHLDVMDGHFVPNITLGPPLVKCWRAAEPALLFDAHLMIENPMRYAEDFRDAGSQIITIHAEASRALARDLRALRQLGVRPGVSIKPGTPVRAIRDVLDLVDLVLVMTVEPGFGGQALIPSTLNKVRELELTRREQGLAFRLQVDGGINRSTAPLAVAAGADVLVAGSAVFSPGKSVADNLAALRDAIAAPRPRPERVVARAAVKS